MMKLTNKRKRKVDQRFVYLIFMLVCLIIIGMITIFRNSFQKPIEVAGYPSFLEAVEESGDPLTHINADFTIDKEFSSHLPLIIIDMNGDKPPISMVMNAKEDRFVQIEGVEPYIDGRLSVIDGKEINKVSDQPALSSLIRIKRRGNSSMVYEKAQYLIKLYSESGEDRELSLFNMGKESEWVLNGSMADKSMIRNYLAYQLSSQIFKYTPDNVYCELLIKNGENYSYNGVYLMGESIKQGPYRVNIEEYDSQSPFNSYLLRRDRFDEKQNILKTYATDQKLTKGYIALRYPNQKKATAEMTDYVTDEVSQVEKILYSENYSVFSTYPDYIDVDSFIDYFLLNEFLGSYDAGNYSTYMYKDLGGKLAMGPVWDFDGTMDNFIAEPLNIEVTAFQYKPLFDRLMTDLTFVKKLEKRYLELRRDVLSEKNVIGSIDNICNYINVPQKREWYRWGHIYKQDNRYNLLPYLDQDGEILYREADTYDQEIYRIKTALRGHGNELAKRLKLLEKSTKWETGWKSQMNIWLLVIALFFSLAAIKAQQQ